ncbi:hypothetical protein HRbin19_01594 [bacterium HR19]|nr:hypothetical protein HRbin19_01594 [bacterium HR19]
MKKTPEKIYGKLFVLFFLISYCSKKIPEWIESPYKRFDERRFIVGVGTGESPKISDSSARNEILKQIKVKIKEMVEEETHLRSEDKGKTVSIQEFAHRKFGESTEGILKGTIIKERFYDSKNKVWYSLAIIDKDEIAFAASEKLNESDMEALGILKKIEREIEEEGKIDYQKVLMAISSAEKIIENTTENKIILELLGRKYTLISEEKIKDIKDKIESPDIKVEGTENLPNPISEIHISAKAYSDEKPITGLPITVKINEVFGRKEITLSTDGRGYASLYQIVFLKPGENQIEIISGKGKTQVFNVKVERCSFGIQTDFNFLKEKISQCLTNAGIRAEEIRDEKASDNEKSSEIKIIGDIKSRVNYSGKNFAGEDIFISETSIKLDFRNTKGEKVYEKNFLGRGVGKRKEESVLSSLENALGQMCEGKISITGKELDLLIKKLNL